MVRAIRAVSGAIHSCVVHSSLQFRDTTERVKRSRQGVEVLRSLGPEQHAATFVHIPDEQTNTAETPHPADPLSGIGTLTITKGPVLISRWLTQRPAS
jgi:hypothetical protein